MHYRTYSTTALPTTRKEVFGPRLSPCAFRSVLPFQRTCLPIRCSKKTEDAVPGLQQSSRTRGTNWCCGTDEQHAMSQQAHYGPAHTTVALFTWCVVRQECCPQDPGVSRPDERNGATMICALNRTCACICFVLLGKMWYILCERVH